MKGKVGTDSCRKAIQFEGEAKSTTIFRRLSAGWQLDRRTCDGAYALRWCVRQSLPAPPGMFDGGWSPTEHSTAKSQQPGKGGMRFPQLLPALPGSTMATDQNIHVARRPEHRCCKVGSGSRVNMRGGVVSTTGWIILIVVLLLVFGGGFGWSRRGR